LEKGIKMGEKSRKGVRKVSFAKKKFFMSIDGTFHALALLERGWNKALGGEGEGVCVFPACNVLPSYAGIYKLRRNEV
jgi:hypothetical protein